MGLFGDDYKPDTTSGSDSDLEVTWLNFKELADKYSPENPLVVEGTKEFFKTKQSKFDTFPNSGVKKIDYMVIIRTGENEAVGYSGSSTMFIRECDEAEVEALPKGAPLALLYAGKSGESKNGAFHWVEVKSERSEENKAKGAEKRKAAKTAEKIPF